MIVTVNEKLGALGGQHAAQIRAVDQAAQTPLRRAQRRMMNEHDAERVAGLIQQFSRPIELPRAEPSGRHERAGRHTGRQRDQRHAVAPAQERETKLPSSPVM